MNMGERLKKLNSTGVKTYGDKLFFPKYQGKTVHQILYEEKGPEYILFLERDGKCKFTDEVLCSAEFEQSSQNGNSLENLSKGTIYLHEGGLI